MDIVNRVARAIADYHTRGLDPDVLVVGRDEAEELRIMCENFLGHECKDIGGWEYQGLKVVTLDIASYVGVAAAQENIEESQAQQPTRASLN